MDKKVKTSAYMPPNMEELINDWEGGEPSGDTCRVDALKKIFAWQRGFLGCWTGWANDGKGMMFDYLAVIKSKYDGWKWAMYKPEDMASHRSSDKTITISAKNIYKKLVWTYTGKCPFKEIALRYNIPQISLDEYMDALEWVQEHFYVISPKDRTLDNIKKEFDILYQAHGISGYLIDPMKGIILPSGKRDDFIYNEAFIGLKDFAMERNGIMNLITHPRVEGGNVKVSKDKDSPYKIVTQHMLLGGSAWDIGMDFIMSTYRQERHLNPADPKTTLINLKQKEAEIVGVDRGEYTKMVLNRKIRRYLFDGIDPMSDFYADLQNVQTNIFEAPKDPNVTPF